MTEPRPPLQVIVAYDFSPTAELALERAADVAARAPHHVLHVIAALDPRHGLPVIASHTIDYAYAEEIRAMLVQRVTFAFADRKTASEVQFYVHARIGRPAEQILGLAREVGADLVFIGSHGNTGVERFVLGSVSERVVREAKCPVIVARAKTYQDVELLHVISYEHDRKTYVPPHRFTPAKHDDITRPNDFPIS